MSAGRARRLLARRGGWLEATGSDYSLRVGRDRRSRILLTLDEAGFRQLVENPGLKARPGGGWVVRWRRFSTQVGGLAKVGSGSDYAASLCSVVALSGASPG